MKKILLSILFNLLFSLNSWAMPAVGDYVKYLAPYEGDNVMIEKSILAQDQAAQTFDVHTLISYKGTILQETTYTMPSSFLLTDAKIKYILETCEAREGARGQYNFKGTLIESCEFYNEDSQLTNILGGIPFGQIRFQIYLEGEEFLDFFVADYKDGK